MLRLWNRELASNPLVAALQERPEIKGTAEHLHMMVSKVPILEWFVRQPSDDSTLERWLHRLLG